MLVALISQLTEVPVFMSVNVVIGRAHLELWLCENYLFYVISVVNAVVLFILSMKWKE